MPANTAPIFTLTPNVGTTKIGANANTKSSGDGTVGTDIMKIFTAGSNGSFVNRIRFALSATSASTGSAATTHRIYYSTVGSGSTTGGSDTFLIAELAVAAQTANQSGTATLYFEVPLNFPIPSGSFIHVSTHTANNANTFWSATCFGGDY